MCYNKNMPLKNHNKAAIKGNITYVYAINVLL